MIMRLILAALLIASPVLFGFADLKNESKPQENGTAAASSESTDQPLFPMKVNGKWGYIDKMGKVIIEPQFKEADSFSEGFAWVRQQNLMDCYVDKTGKIVIDPPGFKGWAFSEGLAAVDIGSYDKTKIGFIDKSGKFVIKPQFSDTRPFSEGLAAVQISGKWGGSWGFIDHTGKFAIKPQFGQTGTFSEGLAAAQKGEWGFIDKTGKYVIEPQFDDASGFSENLALVRYKLVIKPGHPSLFSTLSLGLMSRGRPITIKDNGVSITLHNYKEIKEWVDGVSLYQGGYIDKTGKSVIVGPKSEFYPGLSSFSEGLAVWEESCKSGFIDATGKIVIEPQFYDAENFSDGLAAVHIMGDKELKWGYIDATGKIVIDQQYDDAFPFNNGLARVGIGYKKISKYSQSIDKWGYIDKTGKYVWEPSS